MTSDEQQSRETFERWIILVHRKSARRFSDHASKAVWPGKYCDLQVQLAWEAWWESRRVVTGLIPGLVEEEVKRAFEAREVSERLLKTENGAKVADSPSRE